MVIQWIQYGVSRETFLFIYVAGNAELLCECLARCIERHPAGLFAHFPALCSLMQSYLRTQPVPTKVLVRYVPRFLGLSFPFGDH